jgi:hypothetical protein
VADISDSEVVVAILAHLGLPIEAPIARARSPGFDLRERGTVRAADRRRDDVAKADVCREDDARDARGRGSVIFRHQREGEEGARGAADRARRRDRRARSDRARAFEA